MPEADIDRDDLAPFRLSCEGGLLVLFAEEAFEDRMARPAEPELACFVDIRGVHAEISAIVGLRGDEIETGEQVEGVDEGFGDPSNLAASSMACRSRNDPPAALRSASNRRNTCSRNSSFPAQAAPSGVARSSSGSSRS